MAAKTIEEGKYKVQTVGPVKTGTAKSSGKPFKTFDLQFEGDANWYNCFWVRDTDPTVGEELEGSKQSDDQFGLKFAMKFAGGNRANWNPAGANAAVMQAAVAVVNGFLGLKGEHLTEWEKKRKKGQTAVEQYLETVKAIAGELKQEVVKLGGTNETQTGAKTTAGPQPSGDPGPLPPGEEDWTEEEEQVDLGPM